MNGKKDAAGNHHSSSQLRRQITLLQQKREETLLLLHELQQKQKAQKKTAGKLSWKQQDPSLDASISSLRDLLHHQTLELDALRQKQLRGEEHLAESTQDTAYLFTARVGAGIIGMIMVLLLVVAGISYLFPDGGETITGAAISIQALTGVTLDAPAANQSVNTGDTFTMTCTPTCDGVDDPAMVNIQYEYSTSADCSSPIPIDTDTGTTDVLSVGTNNETTTCGTAISDTITGRNEGTVHITCQAEALAGSFTGGCREVAVTQVAACGQITQDTTLSSNLTASGTCFVIGAPHITLDCNGFEINYSRTEAGAGIINRGYDNVTIRDCLIRQGGAFSGSPAILFNNVSLAGTIHNNTINTSGASSFGIQLNGSSNSSNISQNVITTNETSATALFIDGSHNITIFSNNLTTLADDAHGILLDSHNSTITLNFINVTHPGQGVGPGTGIFIYPNRGENILFNNTIIAIAEEPLSDTSGLSTTNTLLYNNSHGLLNWTSTNLTTNLSLIVGTTVFLENNTIGLINSPQALNLNGSAQIEFKGLAYSATPQLLKAGVRCDDTADCNITYITAEGRLTANVSSFSNYTPNAPPTHDPPILNTTDLSSNNTNQNLTLYPQNASDPDQDSVKNITNWLLNGTSIMLLNLPFEGVNATPTNNAWDYSGYGNNGSDQGAAWNSSGGYDGKGAYDFDGIDDYLHLGNVLGNLVGRDQFTIMAWINHDSGTGIQYIMVKNGPFIFYVQNSLLVGAIYNGTSWTYQGTNGGFRDQAWEHVAMTYNGSAIGMYINGRLNTTGVKTGTLVGAGCVEIGRYNTGTCGVSPANYFNGTIDELQIYNRSLSAEQILALYNNRTDLIVSQETTAGQNWTADVTPNDGFSDGAQLRSNQVIILEEAAANNLPTAPLPLSPANGSSITNRTPQFAWDNATDADADQIYYHLQVDDNNDFSSPEINVSNILPYTSSPNTTYNATTILNVDTTYFWRVRANDSTGFGSFSATVNFTIDSLLSVNLLTGSVQFGTLAPGAVENTTDSSPEPFRLENNGNINFNISINASTYFTAVAMNTSNYQFQFRESEAGAFNTSASVITWRNMSASDADFHLVDLNWQDVNDDAFMDLNITVPGDESPGLKSSTITFTITG